MSYDENDARQFRPQWLSPEGQAPFKLDIDLDIMTREKSVRLSTPRLAAGLHIDYALADRPEIEAQAVDMLTGQIKRRLLERYGLEADVKAELMHKLRLAARTLPNPDRNAVLYFLDWVA